MVSIYVKFKKYLEKAFCLITFIQHFEIVYSVNTRVLLTV